MRRRKTTLFGTLLLLCPLVASAAEPEATDEEALEDDILLVLDLPLAAQAARDAGVPEAELTIALASAQEAGLTAGETALIVDEETAAVRKSGARVGFDRYLAAKLIKGERGKAIAAGIAARKTEKNAMTEAELEAAKAKLAAQKAKHQARRAKLVARRATLIAGGKKRELVAREIHKDRRAALKARHDELMSAHLAARKDLGKDLGKDLKDAPVDLQAEREDLAATTPAERKAAKAEFDAGKAARKDAKGAHKDAKKNAKKVAKQDMKPAGKGPKGRLVGKGKPGKGLGKVTPGKGNNKGGAK